MREFQVGDRVVRKPEAIFSDTEIQVVTSISKCGEFIRFRGEKFGYTAKYFDLVGRVNPKPFNREDYL